MKKICVVTGSRAEYGLLSRLMRLIQQEESFVLQIIATNMHLSPEYGLTYKEIERDGFVIDKKVVMLLSSDTANGTTKSVGLATIGFGDAFEDMRPDLLLVLGDRFEILSAVTAALFYKIPVAHLHGGEITEGAYDDAIRHAITKMSHLHFTSTEEYRKRVLQLGEDPARVFNVGAIGLDNIKHIQLLNRVELENDLQFRFGDRCVLVTFHPATLEAQSAEKQMENLLRALESVDNLKILFTLPNSDTEGRVIIRMINEFVQKNHEKSVVFSSLGQLRYLSALQFVCGVVGNSSSGILEVPSFRKFSLNIGARQRGRLKSDTVIECEPTFDDIKKNLLDLVSRPNHDGNEKIFNPYEKENTAEVIISILKQVNLENIVVKKFITI